MLRLTGGEFRGRMIHTPSGDRTRPTQARLRQAWFNSLQAEIPGSQLLDLFAGSGSLGFEALSRGAEHVTFVEFSVANVQLIKKNIELLKVEDRVTVISDSVERCWSRLKNKPFDLVLADPPYEAAWEERLINDTPWSEVLKEDGHFCLEWGVQKSVVQVLPDQTPFLVKTREKNYGDSALTTYAYQKG